MRLHELGRGVAQGENEGSDQHRHGSEGPTARETPLPTSRPRTRVIAISSGKGGVGKSTVTVNLAVRSARRGASVAILDADVYGFSVPSMLGIDHPPMLVGDLLIPPVAYGVRCISMGFFVDEDQAVLWRGPMLHKALEQFLVDVHWGRPDFLLLDLPPGTGDVRCPSPSSSPCRGAGGDHAAACRGARCPACRRARPPAPPSREGRDRERVLVHRRRRQALRALREWRR